MSAGKIEVLKVELVFVGIMFLNDEEERRRSFERAVDTEIIAGPTSVVVPVAPRQLQEERAKLLKLGRDQVTLALSPSRSVMTREYPEHQQIPRLSEIVELLTVNTDLGTQQLRAIGYNFDLMYQQDAGVPSSAYLAERVFSIQDSFKDWTLRGGTCRLNFADNRGKLWNLVIEPRFNDPLTDNVYVQLNQHCDTSELPDRQGIEESMSEALATIEEFIHYLDGLK